MGIGTGCNIGEGGSLSVKADSTDLVRGEGWFPDLVRGEGWFPDPLRGNC